MRDEVAVGVIDVRTEHTVPEWTVHFLRTRCWVLQESMGHPDRVPSPAAEEDSIHCWCLVLLAAADLPEPLQSALDELHLLHAQVVGRMARGGVGDISEDVELLVRTVLIERLQRLTDTVIDALVA